MIQLPALPPEFRAATAFGFTPDGRQLAVGYQTFRTDAWSAAWWEWADNRIARSRHAPGLTLGADGQFVSTLDLTRKPVVEVFAADLNVPLLGIPVDSPTVNVSSHVVAPGGREVVVEHAGRFGFHRLSDGAGTARAKTSGHNVWLEFSASGRWLYCRSTRAVRLWDRENKHKLIRLKSDSWNTAAVSADDTFAAVSGPTGQAMTVWNLETRAEVLRIELPFVAQGAVWLPDGRLLVTAGREGVRIWNVAAGVHEYTFTPPGGMPTRLAVSPDGLVAAALMYERQNCTAVVWDL